MHTIRAAAYDLAHHIEPEIRAQLFDENTTHDLVDVVRKLRDSHTPGWLYYYLNEVETPPNLGRGLAALIDEETINDVAREYAESENPRINLAHPGASNWMSEDPLAPVRNQYDEKQNDIGDAVVVAYADALGESIPLFTDDGFQQWFKSAFLDEVNYLSWAVHEQTAADRGSATPTETVAEWHVKCTRGYHLTDLIATYRARGEDLDAHFEYWRELSQDERIAEADQAASESDVPVASPSLPSREVGPEEIQERLGDDDTPQ